MNALARAVLAACAQAGVAEYVVCAGARNAALVMPLVALSERENCSIRVWNFSEERAAGFFALGRARALQRPVAVVTTSGTAVAELLPAIVEAFYQKVPLLALTADRPRSFRGTGAPQAIEQVGIFSDYSGSTIDVASLREAGNCLQGWSRFQPAHLNVCFPEPAADDCMVSENDGAHLVPVAHSEARVRAHLARTLEVFLESNDDVVVLLGNGVQDQETELIPFLVRLGAPVLAEALSGFREAPELRHLVVAGGDSAAARLSVGCVLRIGDVPVWRLWRDLELRPEVPVFSVTLSEFPGLSRASIMVRTIDWDTVKCRSHARQQNDILPALDTLLNEFPRSECGLIRGLSEVIPEDALVFLGNSLPVREWNLASTMESRGLRCVANRGANGIDGILSTALGMGADEEEVWIVVGDLTSLYDLSAPWVLQQMHCRKVRIVIVNNGGGQIFSRLPSLNSATAPQKELMANTHGIRFHHWAAMWGMPHHCVTEQEHLNLEAEPCVIELLPDAEETQRFWEEWGQG
ncbi:MAG: 2-succinyl-5-enolpyruvyl-6-hydroxy-3-cyclohexene-1-carboxylate synthase [Verrucomicrobiales bacterium]|jgi:2-succinyl-5-enolpyruvyl-6-hydroxy-3-cyclohexene-1-carboxylate synthase